MFGSQSSAILQTECTDRIQCPLGNLTFSGGRSIQSLIMHKDQLSVFGFLNVQLHDIGSQPDRTLYCCQRIFRCKAPIRPMGDYGYFFIIRIRNLCVNCLHRFICKQAERKQQNNSYYQIVFHIHFYHLYFGGLSILFGF